MLITIIGILVALVLLGCAVVALYIAMQGDAEMRLLTKKRTEAVKVSEQGDRLDFQLEVHLTILVSRRAQFLMLTCVFTCLRSNMMMYYYVAR